MLEMDLPTAASRTPVVTAKAVAPARPCTVMRTSANLSGEFIDCLHRRFRFWRRLDSSRAVKSSSVVVNQISVGKSGLFSPSQVFS
jgi:hypothetical protein